MYRLIPVFLAAVVGGVILLCSPSVSAKPARPADKTGAEKITADKVNNAEFPAKSARNLPPEVIAKAQILLDQAHFSPGEIDAKHGENLQKAVKAFAQARGLPSDGKLNKEVWNALSGSGSGPVLVEYQITEEDLKGPFKEDLPSKMEEMQGLPALPYRSVSELLAEKFHLSEDLLKRLNTGSSFDQAGTTILVPKVREPQERVTGARIEIDKGAQTVRVLSGDNLIAVYPATVGSDEKPSPSGDLKVTGVTRNPEYRYNPDYRFKGVSAEKPFTIQPGPNNPVGNVWIGLSEKGYGIHGTPEPEKVSKAESHGCVRLTNWDADELARMASKGLTVAFLDTEKEKPSRKAEKRRR